MAMRKMCLAILAIVAIPALVSVVYSASQYIGQVIQQVSQSGTWNVGLSTGTNTVGKVDQGAGGASAWKVDGSAVTQPISAVSLPLPTGAATETTLSGVKTGTDRIPAQGQASMSASLPVVVASNQTAIPISIQTSSAPVHVRVTATTTSSQLLAANANRKGLECESACTNPSGRVFIRFGASAATANDKPIEACSSWEPPAAVIPTSAIQVLSDSGSAVITCVEY